jgi:hypothetical protein
MELAAEQSGLLSGKRVQENINTPEKHMVIKIDTCTIKSL